MSVHLDKSIGTAASQTASFNSAAQVMQERDYSIQYVWTEDVATLAGTVKLQASNNQTDWEDIAGSSVTISGAGSTLWNVSNASYMWVRTVFTRTTGTGSFTGKIVSKKTGW